MQSIRMQHMPGYHNQCMHIYEHCVCIHVNPITGHVRNVDCQESNSSLTHIYFVTCIHIHTLCVQCHVRPSCWWELQIVKVSSLCNFFLTRCMSCRSGLFHFDNSFRKPDIMHFLLVADATCLSWDERHAGDAEHTSSRKQTNRCSVSFIHSDIHSPGVLLQKSNNWWCLSTWSLSHALHIIMNHAPAPALLRSLWLSFAEAINLWVSQPGKSLTVPEKSFTVTVSQCIHVPACLLAVYRAWCLDVSRITLLSLMNLITVDMTEHHQTYYHRCFSRKGRPNPSDHPKSRPTAAGAGAISAAPGKRCNPRRRMATMAWCM